MSEKEKKKTLKSVTFEIDKCKAQIEKKESSVLILNGEIKALKAKLKEYEVQHELLAREQLQKKLEVAWFKDNKMPVEQLNKFIDLGTHLIGKIDELNVEDILAAIDVASDDKKNTQKPSTINVNKEMNNTVINHANKIN